MRSLRLTVLLLAAIAGNVRGGTKFGSLCILDPEQHQDFAVIDSTRRILARTMSNRELQESSEASPENGSDVAPLYHCACDEEDAGEVENPFAFNSYCPLNTICGVPLDGSPLECVDMKVMNGIARMAWPIFLITAVCLVLVFSITYVGLALVRYFRKRCRSSQTIEDIERGEVDELLEVARMDPPPERPPRKQIFKFQLHQYQSYIIDAATLSWRREWKNYRKTHKDLYLRTKKFEPSVCDSPDKSSRTTSMSASDDDHSKLFAVNSDKDSKSASSETSLSSVSQDSDSTEKIQQNDEVTCSICIAAIEEGQKVGDLKCGHVFHVTCLKDWLGTGRRNTCPLCQEPNIASREPSSSHTSEDSV